MLADYWNWNCGVDHPLKTWVKDHVSWSEYGPNCPLGSEKSMGAHTGSNVQVFRALLDGLNTSSPAEKLWAQGLDSRRSLLLTEE